jgi:hypothetical protein
MVSLDRVKSNANICSIEIAFNGDSIPSVIGTWQPFYNSFERSDFTPAYTTLSSVSFLEESINNAAGTFYKQKVVFSFPSNDSKRAERIALLQKMKFIKLTLTEGESILIGRNDYKQNKKPEVNVKTNHHLCEVSIESTSIFPSGFTKEIIMNNLPTFLPFGL